jgi:hypothetical protein
MPRFESGNQEARKARGKPKKPEIAHLLERFAPRVLEVVEEMLNAADPRDRWTAAREVMPYLWGKRSAVTVQQEGEPIPTLSDYLATRRQAETLTSLSQADIEPTLPVQEGTQDDHDDYRSRSRSAPVSLPLS